MNVTPSTSLDAEADAIDRVCDAFERAWREGERPRIEEYLAQTVEPLRSRLWAELVQSELECRRRAGDTPSATEYLERFPDRADALRDLLDPKTIRDTPSARRVATLPVGRSIGGYQLLEEIGRGGMGVVYRARQVALHRDVALKMILAGSYAGPEERTRFRREAEAAARLRHPHIVQIHEIGEEGGLLFLAMEYVAGSGLDRLLARWHASGRVGLSPRDAAGLVETLGRAMHHAHGQGIVHRDLKPANILLGISDFRFPIAKKKE